MTRQWRDALRHFRSCLPPLPVWIVAYEPQHHARLVRDLAPSLGTCSLVRLGVDSPQRLRDLALRHHSNRLSGFLEFAVHDGTALHGGIDYSAALMEYGGWPNPRLRLAFDVTDANAQELFSEDPKCVQDRCFKLKRRLDECRRLLLQSARRERYDLSIHCATAKWQINSGLGVHDYILPGGEIASTPTAVDGELYFDGWIVGTMPFGIQFGWIRGSSLMLRFRRGKVISVSGDSRALCAALDAAFTHAPGLNRVVELGFGQSKAVRRAGEVEQAGRAWHERRYGLHLGVGASLDPRRRATQHHLDFVFREGRVVDENHRRVLRWS